MFKYSNKIFTNTGFFLFSLKKLKRRQKFNHPAIFLAPDEKFIDTCLDLSVVIEGFSGTDLPKSPRQCIRRSLAGQSRSLQCQNRDDTCSSMGLS